MQTKNTIDSNRPIIAVQGLGYVGSAMAVAVAAAAVRLLLTSHLSICCRCPRTRHGDAMVLVLLARTCIDSHAPRMEMS